MLKRSLSVLALLLVMIPMAAFAGNVTTRVMTTGGSITVNPGNLTYTSGNGSVTRAFTGDATVAMTPLAGYLVSSVKLNGVEQGKITSLTVPLSSTAQTVAVSFARALIPVTATSTSNDGTVTPTGTTNVYAGTTATYNFAPYAGKSVEAIAGLEGLANVTYNGATTVTYPSPALKVTFTVPNTGSVNIVASFVKLTASAGEAQTVLFAGGTASATLSGSTSGPATLAWSQTSGPATVSIAGATSPNPQVTLPAAGTYQLKLTATDGANTAIAYTTVTATTSVTSAAQAQCVNCHNGHNPVVGPTVYPAWSKSVHAANPESICAGCHVGAYSGSHPAPSIACVQCHTGARIPAQSAHTGSADCSSCHTTNNDAHTAKFASVPHAGGTAFLKAQYVSTASLAISCADCHTPELNTTNQAILVQFSQSAHGNPAGEAWLHYDWRTSNRSSCARCHTGTGFVAKLGNENNISSAFQSGDVLKPGEALTCSACHVNAGTGELRAAAQQFTINMKNAAASYDVAGASTLCARCHSGRETGESIKADITAATPAGDRGFVDSHYQPVTGIVYNKGGYEYAGQSYDLGSHKLLGATGQGPCVTCHMPGKDHTFVAAACSTCHDASVDGAALKANYDTALNNLKLALEAKGIYYGPVHPFFFTEPYAAGKPNPPFTKWDGVYGALAWKDTMGAAFNYNMLWSEKGAYAHNYAYAMKLITDSIDFINDGSVNGN